MSNPATGSYSTPFKATYTGIKDLFKPQTPAGLLKQEERLDNKTALITGASSGLGFAVSMQLAERGAHIIMACRSGIPEKGEQIRRVTGRDLAEMMPVDLSDLKSIQNLVKNIKKKEIKLDIIVCNAAIVPRKSRKTKQDLEEMFVVNYLAKYLLIRLLLQEECLNISTGRIPRIIIISSESHRDPADYDWDNFGIYHDYGIGNTLEKYGYYKLLLTTFLIELSRKLNKYQITDVSIFALCPGPVNSNIAREAPLIFQPFLKLIFRLFFRSPEKAALPVIYLAASREIEGKAIDYLHFMTRKDMDPKAMNPENGHKIWELSERLLECKGFSFQKIKS